MDSAGIAPANLGSAVSPDRSLRIRGASLIRYGYESTVRSDSSDLSCDDQHQSFHVCYRDCGHTMHLHSELLPKPEGLVSFVPEIAPVRVVHGKHDRESKDWRLPPGVMRS